MWPRRRAGTHGVDAHFLQTLLQQQSIRETDLREVVTESLQYIDERKAHWSSVAESQHFGGTGSSPKAAAMALPAGLGAVLDSTSPRSVSSPPPPAMRIPATRQLGALLPVLS
eukprot:COSAG01_NODE_6456_length_3658_cov_74.945771_2_plen_113_part_00